MEWCESGENAIRYRDHLKKCVVLVTGQPHILARFKATRTNKDLATASYRGGMDCLVHGWYASGSGWSYLRD